MKKILAGIAVGILGAIAVIVPQVSVAQTPQATVRFNDQPSLKLTYDGKGGAAMLTGTFNLTLKAGASDIYLPVSSGQVSVKNITTGKNYGYTNSNFALADAGNIVATTTPFGEKMYYIRANTDAQITIKYSANPKQLFAGAYTFSLTDIGLYEMGKGYVYNVVTMPAGVTNTLTITGEVSPYINSASITGKGIQQLVIEGVRFANYENFVTAGNTTIKVPSSNRNTRIVIPLSRLNVGNGSFNVSISHPVTGASNRVTVQGIDQLPIDGCASGAYYSNVTGLPCTATTTPVIGTVSAKIIGNPTFRLTYNPVGKESSLVATFVVQIEAQNGARWIYNNFYMPILDSNGNVDRLNYSERQFTPSIPLSTATDGYGRTLYYFPANKNVNVTITRFVRPQDMYSGVYSAMLRTLYIQGRTGDSEALDIATNSWSHTDKVTVIGEGRPAPTTPTPATLGIASAMVTKTPTFGIHYSGGQEAGLSGRYEVVVGATGGEVRVYNMMWMPFVDARGVNDNLNRSTRSVTPLSSASVTKGVDQYGREYYTIPSGKTAEFVVFRDVYTKDMYSGTYYAALRALYVDDVRGTASELKVAETPTRTVTIVGENRPNPNWTTNPPTIAPSISSIYPNGGQKFNQGSTYGISWKSVGLGDRNVEVAIVGNNNGVVTDMAIGPNQASNGYFNWTVPANFPLGNYKIRVSTQMGTPLVQAMSPATFQIVNMYGEIPTVDPVRSAETSFTASYFNNLTLAGTPVLTRTETAINLASAPTGVNSQEFSARWDGAIAISEEGTYKFTMQADDGVRIWIDGAQVLDKWARNNSTYTFTKALTKGSHSIKVEYFQQWSGMVARLTWNKVSAASGSQAATILESINSLLQQLQTIGQ